jgi:hypothetical protein
MSAVAFVLHPRPPSRPAPAPALPLAPQIAYQAQMIRTWSLLLRSAQRGGFILPGRGEAEQLQEHTFIFHPVEAGTCHLTPHPPPSPPSPLFARVVAGRPPVRWQVAYQAQMVGSWSLILRGAAQRGFMAA